MDFQAVTACSRGGFRVDQLERPGGGRFGREIGEALFHAMLSARNVRSNLPAEKHTPWFDIQDVGPEALSWRLALSFADVGALIYLPGRPTPSPQGENTGKLNDGTGDS
jgi:hypothetical protein